MKLQNHILTLRYALPLLLCVFCSAPRAAAQADAQFSQYFEVPSYYNAGAIGTTDLLRIRAGARLQWLGIDNAPTTFLATADMPLKLFGKRIGVGLVMQQESYGLYKNMNLGAQLAYKQKLFKGVLTAGVQLGFVDQSWRGSDVYLPSDDDYHQGTDDAIPTQDIRGNAFDLGFGLFYTHRWFWAGLSGTHLTNPTISLNAESGSDTNEKNYEFEIGRAFYFMAGSNIPIKNTLFEVMPSLFVKSDFTFTTAELTARVRYNKFLTFGVGYRYKDALIATLAADYRNFFIGYSYDYSTSDIAKASSGSHEIFIGYRVKLNKGEKNRHRHKNIRIM